MPAIPAREAEVEGYGVQGHLQLHSKVKISLGSPKAYMYIYKANIRGWEDGSVGELENLS